MAHSATFNATSRCGNMLQVFLKRFKNLQHYCANLQKNIGVVMQIFAYRFGNKVVFKDISYNMDWKSASQIRSYDTTLK